jgi:hypothetical protein
MGSVLAGHEGFCGYERGLYRCELPQGNDRMVLINSTYPQTHLRELVSRLDVCLEPELLSRLSVSPRSKIVAFSRDMHGMSIPSLLHSGRLGFWVFLPSIFDRPHDGRWAGWMDRPMSHVNEDELMKYYRWISLSLTPMGVQASHVV